MSRRRSKSGSRSRSNSEDSRKQGDFGYLFSKKMPKKSIVKRSKSKKSLRTKSKDSIEDLNFDYLFKNPGKIPKTGIGHFTPVEVPNNVPYGHWKPLETPKERPKSRGRKKVKAAGDFLRANLMRGNLGVVGGKKTRRKKTRGKKKRHRRTKKY